MKVVIVEDEEAASRGLINILQKEIENLELLSVVGSVKESVAWFSEATVDPDLAFFDIQLKDGISLEIFDKINIRFPVIFTTAYDEYAIQAFKTNSIDYLLKPLDQRSVHDSLKKYQDMKLLFNQSIDDAIRDLKQSINKREKYKKRFLVKAGKRFFYVETQNIACIYTSEKIVRITTFDNQHFQLDLSLEQLEEMLPPDKFYRINRQCILNIAAIEEIENDYGTYYVKSNIHLQETLKVSRYRVDDFKRWIDYEH